MTDIVIDHFNTLRDENKKINNFDVFIFFVVPIIFGVIINLLHIRFDKDFYNTSITFFGIFIALLLNIQVAIFGIFTRKWSKNSDENIIVEYKFEIRNKLINEVDCNISYLVFICIISLVYFILVYSILTQTKMSNRILYSDISAFIYSHFLLNLLMVTKRSHALFSEEYKND
ncbi:hypothetical protein [Gluconobacter kondonii]|uniref:Uncharacterized protein n=1 Tax=Gluconobacter kondonii TaxID=941463 RepID=A0ABQ5WUM3_9PROT|nr:hypothetical protein [Gluconobacter kondonii]GLQ67191.1 hypothetical protein GCM10007870_27760 [Gluconobacter kondonii]